jgi:hypothetical protein
MGLWDRTGARLKVVAAAGLVALIGLAAARASLSVDVVRKAAGIPETADGVGKFLLCRAAGYAESRDVPAQRRLVAVRGSA